LQKDHKLLIQWLPLVCLLVLALIGILWPDPTPFGEGLVRILRSPNVLIHDFMAIGGIRAALVNASLVGLLGYSLLLLTKTPVTGSAMAAVFIMTGFALFGKTPVNCISLITGVYLFSRVKGESFQRHVIVAMFSTALAPIVSQVAYGFGYGLPVGILVGIATGFLVPSVVPHLFPNHQGFLLYNVGFTAGFVGTLVASQMRAFGLTSQTTLIWGDQYHWPLTAVFGCFFASFILLGLLLERGSWRRLPQLMRHPGRIPSDFLALEGLPVTLINMGCVGLVGLLYILLVGGVVNGPTLGALLTLFGFGAFGKHPRNIVFPMLGVYIGTLINVYNAADAGPLLGALFGTCTAPLSGYYGPLVGILAGYLHLGMVTHVGWLHGGLNLYNNGFAGGLVTLFVVAMANALPVRRPQEGLEGQ